MAVRVNPLQKSVSELSVILGAGLMYAGAAGAMLMAIVGTASIDIVLLSYAEKQHDSFLTGFLLGMMFNRNNHDDFGLLLLLSPLTTTIAIGLSLLLGVPQVGVALFAGWCLSLAALSIGYALYNFGESIKPATNYRNYYEDDYEESGCCGLFAGV